LGHGSISTTLNIYAHVLAEHLEQFERQRAKVLGISGTYRAPDGVDGCRGAASRVISMTRGGAAW
jgi:hypothetical protein